MIQYVVRRFGWGSAVANSAWIDSTAHIDRTYPKGVVIEDDVWIGPHVLLLTHDMARGIYLTTRVGPRSVVGPRAVIMPGVTIGANCVIEPGSVVSRNIPDGHTGRGNPVRIAPR